jgi:FxsC-like protein
MGGVVITPDAGERASYFFLSQAHSPPLAGASHVEHDRWGQRFFSDLTAAVSRLGSPRHELAPGVSGQEILLGSNWRTAFAHAVGVAAVFVPLYSPGYFARSWPGREWACFEQRMIDAGVEHPLGRFAPVLWIPLPPGQDHPGLDQALALGAAESAYAQNGLRALLRLGPYNESYQRIVERLAGHIVELAEGSPLPPSAVPDIDKVRSPFGPPPSAAVFVVAVAQRSGPSAAGLAGPPYAEIQEPSLAERAAIAAERRDFAVLVRDLDEAGSQLDRHPGVILIDPWYVAAETGLAELGRVADQLPPWILPVLLLNPGAGRREAELARRVRLIFSRFPLTRTETAGQAMAGVTSLEQFNVLMPFLIAEAERRYLRRGPIIRAAAQPGSRPRLRGGESTAIPAVDKHKEDLDA